MKVTGNTIKILTTLVLIVLVILSCSTSKKGAISCSYAPGTPGNVNVLKPGGKFRGNLNLLSLKRFPAHTNALKKRSSKTMLLGVDNSAKAKSYTRTPGYGHNNMPDTNSYEKGEYNKYLIASTLPSLAAIPKTYLPVSSVIVHNSQNEGNLRIKTNVGSSLISGSGPELIGKSNFSRPPETSYSYQELSKKIETLSLASFLSSLASIILLIADPLYYGLLLTIIFALVAIILGCIGLLRIRKHSYYKGRGLAKAGIIIGIVEIAGLLIFFLILVALVAMM
jgi:hypothetical protein